MSSIIKGNNVGGEHKPHQRKKSKTPKVRKVKPNLHKNPHDLKHGRGKGRDKPNKHVTGDNKDNKGVIKDEPILVIDDPVDPGEGGTGGGTPPVSEWQIGESAVPFMRSKAITFQAVGLKPNTRYFPFFNGVYVGKFCSSVDGLIESELKTTSNGSIVGVFYLPANTFTTGSHKFELVDHVDNESNPSKADPLYGSASATYEASGTLKQMQTQITVEVTPEPPPAPPVFVVPTPDPVVDVLPEPDPPIPMPEPPPPVVCETWAFEYTVYVKEKLKSFTVTTSSATIPTDPKPNLGGSGPEKEAEKKTVTYINTTVNDKGQYKHEFRYTELDREHSYRQEWVGPSTPLASTGANTGKPEGLPDLTNFRPSGLQDTDVIIVKKPWYKVGTTACPALYGLKTPVRRDPIAQSFFIDAAQYPDGVFITSIDVFFKTVDQSTPVTLELRDMSNGLPGSNIMPNGMAYLPGYATAQSDDATVGTKFRFDNPVYLQPSKDYCFVVKSTSLGYNVWCSRVGESDVSTGAIIDTQPFTGTLFKSENDTTWVPDSYEDMKFTINVAVFNVDSATDLFFRPQKKIDVIDAVSYENYYATSQTLPLSFISTLRGTKTLTLRVPQHGLTDGDKIWIDPIQSPVNPASFNNIRANQMSGLFTNINVVDEDTIEITAKTTSPDYVATRSGPLAVREISSMIDIKPGILPAVQTVDVAPTIINMDTFSPVFIPEADGALSVPVAPAIVSDSTFTIYTNLPFNEAMVDYMGTEFDATDIQEYISAAVGSPKLYSGSNVYTGKAYESVSKIDFHKFEEPRGLASPLNEDIHSGSLGGKSLTVKLNMSSTNRYLSPLVDTNGASLVVRTYKVDNQSEEINNIETAALNGTTKKALPVGYLVAGYQYIIAETGTTNFTTLGAADSNPGTKFTKNSTTASGTGTAYLDYEWLIQQPTITQPYLGTVNTETNQLDTTGTGTVTLGNSEIIAGQGKAAAKYKSTVVQMTDFYKGLQVFVTANSPDPAFIDCYVRVSTDQATHMDRQWQWVPLQGQYGRAFSHSSDKYVTNEWLYEFETTSAFNVYDIKLVMRSDNPSIVPKIYGVRAIANEL